MKPVALISMPTLSAQVPSFQLALLKPTLRRAGFDVQNFPLHMYFGSFIGWKLHEAIAEVVPALIGEWIWAKSAFGDFDREEDYFEEYRSCFEWLSESIGITIADLHRIRDEAVPSFLEFCLDGTDWGRFGLIGFTVLFQQQLATLAFAKKIKQKFPEVPIILGGAVFEDDIAEEILRECPQVDFIHCGDADLTFPEFIRRLYASQSMDGLPGIMRKTNGRIQYSGRAPNLLEMGQTPVPDFDEHFFASKETGFTQLIDDTPFLPIETARGCWWGEKAHCIFCGLNRSGMEFRSKDATDVIEMLQALSDRYLATDFYAIDNILDPEYVDTLFGALAASEKRFRLHYEMKASITRKQLEKMHRGGLFSVQPGIESFSTHILKIIRKGTTGIQNLEMLKWTTHLKIRNLYNILTGFPGETFEDHKLQFDLIRKIPHLEPPYAICKARADRGSPMYTNPDDFRITALHPTAVYRWLYPSNRFDLRRVSYYFDHEGEGVLSEQSWKPLYELVEHWQQRWRSTPLPYLLYDINGQNIVIEDGRNGSPRTFQYDGLSARLYDFLQDSRSLVSIKKEFGEDREIESILSEFLNADLIAFLDGRYLALALEVRRG